MVKNCQKFGDVVGGGDERHLQLEGLDHVPHEEVAHPQQRASDQPSNSIGKTMPSSPTVPESPFLTQTPPLAPEIITRFR